MQINYEKEKTFFLNEEAVSTFIKYIFSGNFIANGETHSASKVKILPAIHFYFWTDNNEKDVYKFKENRGKFILNQVKKSNVQEAENFFNIEVVEKIEYFDTEQIKFDNIYSVIYKERMVIDFREGGFKICFDRVTAVDPVNITATGEPHYFCEIEYENPGLSFNDVIKRIKLEYLDESKYYMGILSQKLSLNEMIVQKGISEYLDEINERCYSGYFEQFESKYYFNNQNTELELKIKNPAEHVENELIFELGKKFAIRDEGFNLIEDEYYDFNDILLNNNLSYRIRKTNNNQNRNMFFKVPLEDKGLFSSRTEYMSKFHGYDEDEITRSNCRTNRIMNKYLNYTISDKLVKTLDVKTNRHVLLMFNQGENVFLVGVLFFDESEFIKNGESITLPIY